MRPLRVAMLGTRGMPASYGGVERAVEELSVRLADRGHDVTVYCRSQYCDSREPVVDGVKLRYLPAVDTKHLEAITHTTLATIDACARGYDIIHYHALGPSLLAPLARLARARVVTTVQGMDYERAKWGPLASRVLRLGAWCAGKSTNATICVSHALERRFEEDYGREVFYAPNGVTLPTEAPGGPPFELSSGGYFLFLGRIVPEKAVHLLVEAYRRADVALPLVIAGPSSHSDEYVSQVRAAAEGDPRIRFVGAVYGPEKDALLGNALALCQPSDLEGLPITLLEAMSHARPAVVSDLPEHLEVVGDTAGVVFRKGDAEDLARAVEYAAGHRDELEIMGLKALAIVAERYDWEAIVSQVEAVYERVYSGSTRDSA
jgi:glycosyltransferase involved in cell wall biosynthesis